jgi:hypothetical protein
LESRETHSGCHEGVRGGRHRFLFLSAFLLLAVVVVSTTQEKLLLVVGRDRVLVVVVGAGGVVVQAVLAELCLAFLRVE